MDTVINGFIGMCIGLIVAVLLETYFVKKYQRCCLSVFTAYCSKSKHLKWLSINIWGDSYSENRTLEILKNKGVKWAM